MKSFSNFEVIFNANEIYNNSLNMSNKIRVSSAYNNK